MFKRIIIPFLVIQTHLFTCSASASEQYTVHNFSVGTAVTISGTVIPYKEVRLSAQLPGRIELIAGNEGDRFAEGSILVTLDEQELLAQRRAAYAGLMNAEAALRHAGIQYERELYSPNSPNKAPGGMGLPHLFDQFFTKQMSDVMGESDESLDRRADLHGFTTQIRQARNSLLQAQSQIEQIDAKLRDAKSKAPFEGVITKKYIEVGDTIQPGQPLIEFANIDQLQVEIDVPARLERGLNIGDTVNVRLDVIDTPLQAKVAQIFPIADRQRHTVKIKLDLPASIEGMRAGPGQYVQVDVPDPNAELQVLPVIPKQSLIWRGSLPAVYVYNNEKQELRLLRLGNEIDASLIRDASLPYPKLVTVLSGLKEGDIIDLNPAPGKTSGWNTKTP